jgi:hypothetical protein
LGLWQVLRYRWLLGCRHDVVRAVLIAEREPRTHRGANSARTFGVELVTHADMTPLLD